MTSLPLEQHFLFPRLRRLARAAHNQFFVFRPLLEREYGLHRNWGFCLMNCLEPKSIKQGLVAGCFAMLSPDAAISIH